MFRLRRWLRILAGIALVLGLLVGAFAWRVLPPAPPTYPNPLADQPRQTLPDGSLVWGPNSLRRSQTGIWELYAQGNPTELGLANGILTRELASQQEAAFVAQIKRMVPAAAWLHVLKYVVAWFNRDIHTHVPAAYLSEIYGVSRYADPAYDYVGPAYVRILNYHAAHDIGHALQDKHLLVGCTSFAAWGNASADGQLLLGRNFDFYVGDGFARNKVVSFYRPDSGYAFAMVGWPGMVGAVSGMNLEGLSVTINAAKSAVPSAGATPISLIVREILQHARTIQEAYAIAQRRQAFVSESILIGSAADGSAALIEKSPERTVLLLPDSNRLVCANHFQSPGFATDSLNLRNMARSSSLPRFQRMQELLAAAGPATPQAAAAILRDRSGVAGQPVGLGNELAINQLIAHHSVIFQPVQRRMYVSTTAFGQGSYTAYDLRTVFAHYPSRQPREVHVPALAIPADTFVTSAAYHNYLRFRQLQLYMEDAIAAGKPVAADTLRQYQASNSGFYLVHATLGRYHAQQQHIAQARAAYEAALALPIYSLDEREALTAARDALAN